MKKIIIFALVIMTALTAFTSCFGSGITGYWNGTDNGTEYIFYFGDGGEGKMYIIASDGSMYFDITWEYKNGTLKMSASKDDYTERQAVLDGDTLTLDGYVFTRISKDDVPADAVNASSLLTGSAS